MFPFVVLLLFVHTLFLARVMYILIWFFDFFLSRFGGLIDFCSSRVWTNVRLTIIYYVLRTMCYTSRRCHRVFVLSCMSILCVLSLDFVYLRVCFPSLRSVISFSLLRRHFKDQYVSVFPPCLCIFLSHLYSCCICVRLTFVTNVYVIVYFGQYAFRHFLIWCRHVFVCINKPLLHII